MPTPATTQAAQRAAARDSGRHPAGRRLIARATITLATAGMLAAAPGIASARPVYDDPAGTYCGPGQEHVNGYGCARTDLPVDPTAGDPDGLGGWTSAGLGVLHLALFVLI